MNQHGPAMANVLAKNQTCLLELEISCNLQSMAGEAIIHMLHSNTTLQTLGLDIDYLDGFGDSLASVLLPEHNTTLKTLHLRLVREESVLGAEDADEEDNGSDPDVARTKISESKALSNVHSIVKALEKNASLEHLHMNFYHLSPDTVREALVEPFSALVETNFVLKNLSLRGEHNFVRFDDSGLVDFKLKLNQAGRHNLLVGHVTICGKENTPDDRGAVAPRAAWVEAIIEQNQKHELSIVFYLLSMNPSLCTRS